MIARLFRYMMCVALVSLGLVSCTKDDYEAGDGKYSYMRADFCIFHTDESDMIEYAVLDNGKKIQFPERKIVGWATKSNHTYRALLYYDVSNNSVFSLNEVPIFVPNMVPATWVKETDPLDIESIWVAGGFINIAISYKTGSDKLIISHQVLDIAERLEVSETDGKPVVHLKLVYEQRGVPTYYSVRGYISVPLAKNMQGAKVLVSFKTYNGMKTYEVNVGS